jgi:hypothetical protein
MSRTATRRGLTLIGIAVAVIAALSLTVSATGSMATPGHAPDSTTIGRLSGSPADTAPDRVRAATSISDAAWLAGGLLMNTAYFEVSLPLVER